MPSLDFVYDLKDKLDEENIEYALCIIRKHGKENSEVDIHLNLQTDESVDAVCTAFESLCNDDADQEGDAF